MNRLSVSLILSVFLPAFICNADIVAPAPDAPIPPGPILIQQDLQSMPPTVDLGKITISKTPPKPVERRGTRLSNADWNAMEKESMALNDVTATSKRAPSKYAGFLSEVSYQDYEFKKKLTLTKIKSDRRKKSIVFVFLMNKDKKDSKQKPDHEKKRLHILWPSKRMLLEQKIVEDQYPVDVSIANYTDGYSPGEWNLVLPSKKPREVIVSLMWTF
jgi:hypothetical protein